MKKMMIIFSVVFTFTACNEQEMARNYGGNADLTLPANQKLMMITWKDDAELWYLTRPMKPTDTAETYLFMENSHLGIMEGSVTIKEVKK